MLGNDQNTLNTQVSGVNAGEGLHYAPEKRERSKVEIGMDDVSSAIETLSTSITLLENQLEPVSRPYPSEDNVMTQAQSDRAPESALTTHLTITTSMIYSLNRRISLIRERVEL